MKIHLLLLSGFVISLGLCVQLLAQNSEAKIERRVSPSLDAVLSLRGKSLSSREFQEFKRRYQLKPVYRAEQLRIVDLGPANPRPEFQPLTITVTYGCRGFLVIASSTTYIKADRDLDDSLQKKEPVVTKIQLIVGNCDEGDMWGFWEGAMPFDMPASPEALLERYPNADPDVEEITYVYGAEKKRVRRINYYVPPMWVDFPYTLVFISNKLALIEIFDETNTGRIIRPQTPTKR